MAQKRDNWVKVAALLHVWRKVSDIANLVGMSRTIVYAIKKRKDDGESINRRTGSDPKTVVGRDSLWDAIRETASNDIEQIIKDLLNFFGPSGIQWK